jgi:LTXXQ motif family protein
MFRRLVITVTAMLAIAVVPVFLAGSAQAGRGGGSGGTHGAASHSGGGGGGGGQSFHASGAHFGSYSGRSSTYSRGTHGPRHSAVSYHRPNHSVTNKSHANKSHANKSQADKSRADKSQANKSQADKSRADKSQANKSQVDKSQADKSQANKSLNQQTNWKHNNKFFGRRVFAVWFGPIFWPYAFYDLFDYVFWVCDGYYYYSYGCYDSYGPFWAYGYDDLFGGIYWPYAYGGYGGYGGDYRGYGSSDRYRRRHQVARNDPRSIGPRGERPDELTQLCGGEAASLVHFPFDRIEQKVQPTAAQRASFEALKNAAANAAEKLKASCPSEPASGPLGRLDTAEQRLDAMLDAVSSVRAPLMKFYDSLGDQQKARLDAMGLSPGREAGAGGGEAQAGVVPRICSERNNAVAQLSIEDIEKNVHPTDAQRQNLEDLRNASVRAADAIKASCPSKTQLTVTARIEAVEGRLGAMLDAVKTVRGPLEKFYDSLSDEQRARFNRMGPPSRRTG